MRSHCENTVPNLTTGYQFESLRFWYHSKYGSWGEADHARSRANFYGHKLKDFGVEVDRV